MINSRFIWETANMTIDSFYQEINKSNFYLGMISQVYRENAYIQVENLSLLNHRNIQLEALIPNTINYFVVIDSIQGLFVGEVYQSRVNSSDSVHTAMQSGKKESVFPEIGIEILGILNGNKLTSAGFKTVGIMDKVYVANQFLIKTFVNSIELNEYPVKNSKGENKIDESGKIVYQKKLTNIAKLNEADSSYLSLKPNTLFDRHLLVIGTTNSGKSTSALSVLDKLVLSGKKVLVIDPTGEYRDSFSDDEAEKLLLGENAFISTEDIDDLFWVNFFNLSDSEDSGKAAVLANAISSLRFQNSIGETGVLIKEHQSVSSLQPKINSVTSRQFDFNLLTEQIKHEAVKQKLNKDKGGYCFERDGNLYNASIWLIKKVGYFLKSSLVNDFFVTNTSDDNLFDKIDYFMSDENKKSLYINTSKVSKSGSAGASIINLITNHVLESKVSASPFVLFIDEVHRYTRVYEEDGGLVSIAREGRKKGIFLFLTTQSPKDVPKIILGQVGTFIIHRITHYEELRAIENLLQPSTLSQIRKLAQGESIITSINLLKDLHVYFEKTNRIHYNETPLL